MSEALQERMATRRDGKWCIQCGILVDLRRDYRLTENFCNKAGIKNRDYMFVHRKCNEGLKRDCNL